MNTENLNKVFNAIMIIANITETLDIESLIDALTGYAFDEEDAGKLKNKIVN
jgi:hypothetical protein